MSWRTVFQLPEKEEKEKQVALVSEQVSHISHFPLTSQAPHIILDMFQERAAIREFEGNQSRIEAEIGAIEEVLPCLVKTKDGIEELKLPLNVAQRFRYYDQGQSLEATLHELGATEETIRRYVGNKPYPTTPWGFAR